MNENNEITVQYDDKDNFGRLICIAKKHFDVWSQHNIKPEKVDMKLSFMPVIFNISPEGNTNSELSKKSLVFKQAMSRTLKELEEIGMITSKTINNDKRSNRINLTDDGKEFVTTSNQKLSNLIDNYIELVGEEKFKITMEVLSKMIDYHEGLNTNQ